MFGIEDQLKAGLRIAQNELKLDVPMKLSLKILGKTPDDMKDAYQRYVNIKQKRQ
jgi:hypothetical protein